MKCVALLLFVLLVQSVDKFLREKHNKWTDDPVPTPPSDVTDHANTVVDKPTMVDRFRSKMNNTHGIVIPNELMLTVPLSDVSAGLVTSFRSFHQTLSDLSGCKSESVSAVASDSLKLLDKMAKTVGSLSSNRAFLINDVPVVFLGITDAIARLNIGTSVSDAVNKIKDDLLDVIGVLEGTKNAETNTTKQLNDAVFALTMSVQVLIISIGIIAESGANKLSTITAEANEAVVSLTLILQALIVVVQNITLSIASIVQQSWDIPSTSSVLNSFLWLLHKTLPVITNVSATITSSSIVSSSSVIVSTISVTLTSLITGLNESIGKLQTGVVLEVSTKLETVLFNLIGAEAVFISYVTTSTATVISGIVEICSSDAGMHSKVARHLYPVFQSLLPLSGSEQDILKTLTTLLPSIAETLKGAANYLVYGIGAHFTKSIITHMENIFTNLNKMITLLESDTVEDDEVNKIGTECTKSVQIFGSILIAMTKIISDAADTVNTAALETVLSLPIIHATALYVTEWVSVIASSMLPTKGSSSELFSSLAVTIVAILRHDSSIIETIAAAVTRPVIEVVSVNALDVNELDKSNSQLSAMSGINAKIKIELNQMNAGGRDIEVDGITETAEGNISQVLSGLIGSFSTISLTFSSSLSGLHNSFKQIASSEFDIMRTTSAVLLSITTDLNDISGTATQILQKTTTLLPSIFGRLLENISKLSKLEDVTTSFSTSIASISTALHSLINAINNHRVTSSYLIDAFRELAKTIQVLISTFAAIITSAANVDRAIPSKVSVEVAALPYSVSTVILCIQQVVGTAVATVSQRSGTIDSVQHEFTVYTFSILGSLTQITADATTLVKDGQLLPIPSSVLSSVIDMAHYTSDSLSKISGVLANIQVTLSKQ